MKANLIVSIVALLMVGAALALGVELMKDILKEECKNFWKRIKYVIEIIKRPPLDK